MINYMKVRKTMLWVVGILLIITLSLTTAYFLSESNGKINSNATVGTGDVAKLEFSKSGDLGINVKFTEFGPDAGDAEGEMTATATMTSPEAYSMTYHMYFNITSNNFIYTTDEETPELVLTIQKPDGSYLDSVEGLETTTINSVTGFDVTTKTGMFKLSEDISISTTDSDTETIHNYKVKLYFVNLDSNQNENTNKDFVSEFIMQKDKYRLPILGKASDALINNHSEVEGLIKHSYDVLNSASDNNYRYSGANPENYIMFNNEIWRIIGIYEMYGNKHLKIIRNDSLGNKVMNEEENNSWGDSDIVSYLNDEYYTTLDTNSKSMVYKMYYFIGGYEDIYGTAKAYYDTESSYESNESYMGLMTPSDYGFASSKDNWGVDMSSYDSESNKNNNWLFKGYDMWTMTSDTIAWHIFHYVHARGQVSSDMCYRSNAILPVLYLDPDVEIISGYGTEDMPFILNS